MKMASHNIHRIYTEAKNEREIVRLASARFESFTVQPTSGYYKGRRERSIVLEIIGARPRLVEDLAQLIGRMNGEKSVLILKTRVGVQLTRK